MKYIKLALLVLLMAAMSCSSYQKNSVKKESHVKLYPDYTQLSIPYNIAPLNFNILDKANNYKVVFSSEDKNYFTCTSRQGKIRIPARKWSKMLQNEKGNNIYVNIFLKKGKKWTYYRPITHKVSKFPIDKYMSYRLIYPHTGDWRKMGLYERDMTNFNERVIMENSSINNSCLNCHHASNNNAKDFLFHVRAGKANGTYIVKDGDIRKIKANISDLYGSVSYAWWHPDGKHIVFSVNSVNGRDVNQSSIHLINGADSKSDLVVYDIEENAFYTDDVVFNSNYWETYPYWAEDGKSIYYCRAKAINALDHKDLEKIQYNLIKVEYDVKTHEWGKPEVIIDAAAMDRSVAFPRISPDGRYMMYTLYDFGIFSIWRSGSDLAMYDLKEKTSYLLDRNNTDKTESYHSWSSEGRWFVYASKYPDDECGRPYISGFDPATGRTTKPFILPQKDPEFYRRFILSFNLPELYHTSSGVSHYKLLRALNKKAIPAEVKQGPGKDGYFEYKEDKSSSVWKMG